MLYLTLANFSAPLLLVLANVVQEVPHSLDLQGVTGVKFIVMKKMDLVSCVGKAISFF